MEYFIIAMLQFATYSAGERILKIGWHFGKVKGKNTVAPYSGQSGQCCMVCGNSVVVGDPD